MDKINKLTTLLKNGVYNKKSLVFFVIFLIFIFSVGIFVSNKTLITIPKKGGEINEIIIGSKIRFINPVLALSPADKDLVSLIYSPLFRISKQKKVIENIASYSLSKDKKTYTISLKDNIFFHDGVKLTADDVIFTIKKIQDPLIKSPYYGAWLGVETKKINNKKLEIKIKNEYYQFINNLVLYILPKHLWKDTAPEEFPFSKLNIKPIGSGPFEVEKVERNSSGEIEQYILKSFDRYYPQEAYLDKMKFYFFEDFDQYESSPVFNESNSTYQSFFTDSEKLSLKVLPKEKKYNLKTPKIFGLFVRVPQEKKLLSNKKFRILLSTLIKSSVSNEITITKDDFKNLENFKYLDNGKLLYSDKQTVINITFFQDEKFNSITDKIKKSLGNYGIEVNLQKIDDKKVLENIIRDRNFESILFGYNPGIIKDLFYFFHSSQTNDPGANIAGIKEKNIDKLVLELRKNISPKERDEKNLDIEKKIAETGLFVPLYQSNEFYKLPKDLKNFNKIEINSRENRFDNIENWYLKEERILPFLYKN